MQERLNRLSTLNINCDMARKLEFSRFTIVYDFANEKSRKYLIESHRLAQQLSSFIRDQQNIKGDNPLPLAVIHC